MCPKRFPLTLWNSQQYRIFLAGVIDWFSKWVTNDPTDWVKKGPVWFMPILSLMNILGVWKIVWNIVGTITEQSVPKYCKFFSYWVVNEPLGQTFFQPKSTEYSQSSDFFWVKLFTVTQINCINRINGSIVNRWTAQYCATCDNSYVIRHEMAGLRYW